MQFIQTFGLLGLGVVVVLALRHFGGAGGGRALDTLRDSVRSMAAQLGTLSAARPGSEPGSADAAQLGRSMFRSVINPRDMLWWTRKRLISGINWVIVCNPVDLPMMLAEWEGIVDDLIVAFGECAASKRLEFNGTLTVIQILARDNIPAGQPVLMTYARARALEMAGDAVYAEHAAQETRLMTPDEVAVELDRRTQGAAPSVTPAQVSSRPVAASGHAGVAAQPSGAPVVVATGAPAVFGQLDLMTAPDIVDIEPIQVRAGLKLGRSLDCGEGCIPASKVSRVHAEVIAGDSPVIVDRGSRNGLFVNGQRVTDHVLTDGDFIGLGQHVTLRYQANRSVGDHTEDD